MAEFTRLGDRYDIGSAVGRGGMAEVFEATDSRLNRRVAVKVLRGELARDPVFIERFRREAQAAAGLNHPNIVAVYDTGEDEVGDVHIPYIVMEYVDGVTLRQMLTSGPRIMPERGLEITAGILAALDYAHRHGIIHRDIKPGNVMINAHGDAKVMDFGIARAVSDQQTAFTATSAVMGTAQYLSPEQARGEVVDARSDIYSAGCVLYELLTGRPPFTGETPVSIAYQHVNEQPKSPSTLDPSIPNTLDAIVMHALSKHPSQRYQTAGEMRSDVERAIAGMPINAPSLVPNTPTEEPAAPHAVTTQLPRTDTSVLPAFTPVDPDTAAKRVQRERLKWIAAGLVVLVAIGGMFALGRTFINSGPTNVTVPNLSGKTVDEATQSLLTAQLVLGTKTTQADDNAPAGTIIQQDPPAGQTLKEGQPVNIVVSSGKAQTQVPDLVNLANQDAATVALTDANLVLGTVTVQDSDKAAGKVLSQSVVAGTSVDVGTRVDIIISSGKIAVPQVTGKTKAQGRNDLTNAGFKVQVLTEYDPLHADGTIIAQTPDGGALAVKGTVVTITVASATPPASATPTP